MFMYFNFGDMTEEIWNERHEYSISKLLAEFGGVVSLICGACALSISEFVIVVLLTLTSWALKITRFFNKSGRVVPE